MVSLCIFANARQVCAVFITASSQHTCTLRQLPPYFLAATMSVFRTVACRAMISNCTGCPEFCATTICTDVQARPLNAHVHTNICMHGPQLYRNCVFNDMGLGDLMLSLVSGGCSGVTEVGVAVQRSARTHHRVQRLLQLHVSICIYLCILSMRLDQTLSRFFYVWCPTVECVSALGHLQNQISGW